MIPYNPSSFNTNKTILEQILELKKWLKEHPSYAVYTTYIHYKPAENVDYFFTEINGDPDFVDNIAVGDLLWFGDGYISPIASITIDPNDRENSYVTISQPVTSLIGPTGPQGPRGYDGVSVTNASVNASGYLIITLSNGLTVNTGYVVGPQGTTGPEGPEGPQGPTGPSGVSITNVAIDGNQHLIVTLSDGSTIDAGSVSSGSFDVITITSQTGNFSASDIVKLQKENTRLIYNNIVYTNAVNNGTTLYYKGTYFGSGYVRYESVFVITISNGYYTRQTAPLTSGTATVGQVLTADGYGSSSWQTPSGGAEVVELTGTSGTLSDADFTKVQNANTIIKIDNDYYIHTRTTTSHIIYDHFTYNISWTRVDNNHLSIVISSKAWTLTNNKIPAKQLYEHNIVLYKANSFSISFRVINTTSTAMAQSDVGTYLANNSANNLYLVASGSIFSSPSLFAVVSICLINGNLYTRYLNTSGTESYVNQGTFSIMSVNVNDNVITL